MNNTSKRAYSLYVLAAAFAAGIVILVAQMAVNGGEWAANRANKHIYSRGQIAAAGAIVDSKGVVLAETAKGKRVYNKDKTVRVATLHTVGDTAGSISTGIHAAYRKELSGYSLWNGIYQLKEYGRGSDIHLTIDAKACAAAYKALGNYKGTVGVYNYKTGRILCVASKPAYDINNKPDDILTNTEKYEGVYLNRLLSGVYTPGSVFKTVTALCAIDNMPDIDTRSFTCAGKATIGGGKLVCNGVHGKVNFEKALNKSCNIAFGQLAVELGKEKLLATAESLGFNQSMKIDDVRTAAGMFDLTAANDLDLAWAGIGQYSTLVNPLQILAMMGTIANGGRGVSPYMVEKIVSPSGIVTKRGSLNAKALMEINTESAERLKALLRSDVVNSYGDSRFKNLQMCGKTGTAELKDGQTPHAWFAGFSMRADMPLAVVVVVENGGSGNKVAIPVANKVMQALVP